MFTFDPFSNRNAIVIGWTSWLYYYNKPLETITINIISIHTLLSRAVTDSKRIIYYVWNVSLCVNAALPSLRAHIMYWWILLRNYYNSCHSLLWLKWIKNINNTVSVSLGVSMVFFALNPNLQPLTFIIITIIFLNLFILLIK